MLIAKELIEYFEETVVNAIYQYATNLDLKPSYTFLKHDVLSLSQPEKKPLRKTALLPLLKTMDMLKKFHFLPDSVETKKDVLTSMKVISYPNALCFLDEQEGLLSLPQNTLIEPFQNAMHYWLNAYKSESIGLDDIIDEIIQTPLSTYRLEAARNRELNATNHYRHLQEVARTIHKFTAIVKKYIQNKQEYSPQTKARLFSFITFFNDYLPTPNLAIHSIGDINPSRCKDVVSQVNELSSLLTEDILQTESLILFNNQLRHKLIIESFNHESDLPLTITHSPILLEPITIETLSIHGLFEQLSLIHQHILTAEDGLAYLNQLIHTLLQHPQRLIQSFTDRERKQLHFYIQQIQTLLIPDNETGFNHLITMLKTADGKSAEDLYLQIKTLPDIIQKEIEDNTKQVQALKKHLRKKINEPAFSSDKLPEKTGLSVALGKIEDSMLNLFGPAHLRVESKESEFVYLHANYTKLYHAIVLLNHALQSSQLSLFEKAIIYYDAAITDITDEDTKTLPILKAHIDALQDLFTHYHPFITQKKVTPPPKDIFRTLSLSSILTQALPHSPKIIALLKRLDQIKRKLSFPVTKNKVQILNALLTQLYPFLLTEICHIEEQNQLLPGQLFSIIYQALEAFHISLIERFKPDNYPPADLLRVELMLPIPLRSIQKIDFTSDDVNLSDYAKLKRLSIQIEDLNFSTKDIKKSYNQVYQILQIYNPKYHHNYLNVDPQNRLDDLKEATDLLLDKMSHSYEYRRQQSHFIKSLQHSVTLKQYDTFSDYYKYEVREHCHIDIELHYLEENFQRQLFDYLLSIEHNILKEALKTDEPCHFIQEKISEHIRLFLTAEKESYLYLDDQLIALNATLSRRSKPFLTQTKIHLIHTMIKVIQDPQLSALERIEQIESMKKDPTFINAFPQKSYHGKSSLSAMGFTLFNFFRRTPKSAPPHQEVINAKLGP